MVEKCHWFSMTPFTQYTRRSSYKILTYLSTIIYSTFQTKTEKQIMNICTIFFILNMKIFTFILVFKTNTKIETFYDSYMEAIFRILFIQLSQKYFWILFEENVIYYKSRYSRKNEPEKIKKKSNIIQPFYCTKLYIIPKSAKNIHREIRTNLASFIRKRRKTVSLIIKLRILICSNVSPEGPKREKDETGVRRF